MNALTQYRLIRERKTWQHFVGGLYANTARFIAEAERLGISRRAPAMAVRNMSFGDRLILLRYLGKADVRAFAEAEITGITLEHDIAERVAAKLAESGLIEWHDAPGGGASVERECGSYVLCGSFTVKCDLADVMRIAEGIANERGETLFVMVNARLTNVYAAPICLQPAPHFTRGFTRVAAATTYAPSDPAPAGSYYAIQQYNRKARPRLAAHVL